MAGLQAAAFKRLYPEEFFEGHIKDGFRPDGRVLGVARPVTVGLRAVSSADGSALAKVGASTVLAGVRLEVMVPSAEAPADGQLVVSVEMTPLSSPDYRPGRQPGVVAVIAQRLQDVLLGCGVLQRRELCIAEGQAVWVAYLDVCVLNAAGSLLDAALLAALGALRDTRLPCVHVTEEGNVERDGAEPAGGRSAGGQTVPLRLHGCPLSLTCGVYKGQLIADPDHEEEGLMSASISVVVDEAQQLLGVYSAGPATPAQVLSCAEMAKARHKELLEQLEAAADRMEA